MKTGEAVGPNRKFPVWKTIKLGTHKSADALRRAIENRGLNNTHFGDRMLEKTPLAESETEVDLYKATVKELTGKDSASQSEVDEAIRAGGYHLCPAEVGPQLRLQYPDQPHGEFIHVAMEPITIFWCEASQDITLVYHVWHERGGIWLHGELVPHWNGDSAFVFTH